MLRRQILATIPALFVAPGAAQAVSAATSPLTPVQFGNGKSTLSDEPAAIVLDAVTISRAEEWLERIRLGSIDRRLLDPQLNLIVTDEAIHGGALLARAFGLPVNIHAYQRRIRASSVTDYFRVRFESEVVLTWVLSITPSTKINGFALRHRSNDTIFSATAEPI